MLPKEAEYLAVLGVTRNRTANKPRLLFAIVQHYALECEAHGFNNKAFLTSG